MGQLGAQQAWQREVLQVTALMNTKKRLERVLVVHCQRPGNTKTLPKLELCGSLDTQVGLRLLEIADSTKAVFQFCFFSRCAGLYRSSQHRLQRMRCLRRASGPR